MELPRLLALDMATSSMPVSLHMSTVRPPMVGCVIIPHAAARKMLANRIRLGIGSITSESAARQCVAN
jgi:hypothetical protein